MGSVNVRSSNSSKESGEGAVLSINQSSQDPATPMWDKDKEIKKKNQWVWKYMTDLIYLK